LEIVLLVKVFILVSSSSGDTAVCTILVLGVKSRDNFFFPDIWIAPLRCNQWTSQLLYYIKVEDSKSDTTGLEITVGPRPINI